MVCVYDERLLELFPSAFLPKSVCVCVCTCVCVYVYTCVSVTSPRNVSALDLHARGSIKSSIRHRTMVCNHMHMYDSSTVTICVHPFFTLQVRSVLELQKVSAPFYWPVGQAMRSLYFYRSMVFHWRKSSIHSPKGCRVLCSA